MALLEPTHYECNRVNAIVCAVFSMILETAIRVSGWYKTAQFRWRRYCDCCWSRHGNTES